MKTLTVKFITGSELRSILGACWDEGLDPTLPDEELPDAVGAVLVAICQERIASRREAREPKGGA